MENTLSPTSPPCCYVLGIRSNFRGEDLIEILSQQNIRFKIIWGLEYSKFPIDYIESLVDHRKTKLLINRKLSYAEVSCALGHFEMYENFLIDGSEWGLFVEDDCVLFPKTFELLNRLQTLDFPAVLSLSNIDELRFEPRPFPFKVEGISISNLPEFKECAVHPVGAFAYLINRKAAEIAVHNLRGKRIYSPADFPFEFRNQAKFFASSENYADTRDVASTIEEARKTTYRRFSAESRKEVFLRRIRVIFDYSFVGVLYAKYIGLSGRFYYNEKVILRKFYKNFKSNHSAKISS